MTIPQIMTLGALGITCGLSVAVIGEVRKTRDIVRAQTQRVIKERRVISELLGEAIFLATQANDEKGEPFRGLSKTIARHKEITDRVEAEGGEDV